MKKVSGVFLKKLSLVSLPNTLSFILIGESYLYYENLTTSIIFSRVGKRCFLAEKKCENHEKNKTHSKICFLFQFHILCASFRKMDEK